MLGEGLMYCMQAKLKSCPKSESSINAGGCSFNSFLRRTVRFVGMYGLRRRLLCFCVLGSDCEPLGIGVTLKIHNTPHPSLLGGVWFLSKHIIFNVGAPRR